MKILHVTPSYMPAYSYGGPIKAVHMLCKALTQQGLNITVFTTNSNGDKNLDVPLNKPRYIDGVKVIYHPVGFFKPYYYSNSLSTAIRQDIPSFDIVHIHSIYLYPTLAAAYWCRKYKKPYIINPFGALDPDMIKLKGYLRKKLYIKLIEERNIRKAFLIHAASGYEKDRISACGFNVPVAVVPRAIDTKEYERDQNIKNLKEIYPYLKDKKIILFLGRIHFKKGLDLLAQAFKKVLKIRNDIHLIMAGPGEKKYVEKIKRIFKKMGLVKHTLFTGMLLGNDKLSAFYSSDIFILPSYGENFGITCLEAMACELPMIITTRVGLYPHVKEYNAGIITEPNTRDITEAMMKLLDDENLRKSMGRNGRRLLQEKFTPDRMAFEMQKVYKEILKSV